MRIPWSLHITLACLGGLLVAGEPACAAAPWVEERTVGTFLCRAEFSLDEIHGLLEELRQIQADLTRSLGIPPAKEPIELCLFRSAASYHQFLARNLPTVPYRRALYVKSNGRGMVLAYRGPEFDSDLRHEATHGLLHGALPIVPLWLDEGLAEYFEPPRSQRAFDNPHLTSVRRSLRIGVVPSLGNLEDIDKLDEAGPNHYRDAWAWVHFIFHGSAEAHRELVRLLSDIRSGKPTGTLSQRLRLSVPDAETRFITHFSHWTDRRENSTTEDGIHKIDGYSWKLFGRGLRRLWTQ